MPKFNEYINYMNILFINKNYPYFHLVSSIKVTLVDVVIEKYIYRIEEVVI